MLEEYARESHAGEPEYVGKRRERVLNLLADFEELLAAKNAAYEDGYNAGHASREPEIADCKTVEAELRTEVGKLRMELIGMYASEYKMKAALKACGIARCNSDTCTVCGLHFADCEEERLVDDVEGKFVEIGPACPGAVARELIGEKK